MDVSNSSSEYTTLKLNELVDKDEFIKKTFEEYCHGYEYIPSILPKVKRLIVFGDIHGDYKLLIHLLQLGKLIKIEKKDKIKWIGNDTYVVQVGDQIDRCRPLPNMICSSQYTTIDDEASDVKIMKLCNDLHKQAIKVGGKFISLLGNHEIMNVLGAFPYVSHLGLKEFDDYIDPKKPELKFESGEEGRRHAFASGNEIGTMLGCSRLSSVIVGSNLFVHAGIVDGLINEISLTSIDDFEIINIAIRKWLLGLLSKKYIIKIIKSSPYSMFWTRLLGQIPPNTPLSDPVCSEQIGSVLKMFKIGSIIIGHTPQSFIHSDMLNHTCSNKVWRVDNGSSSAFDRFDSVKLSSGKTSFSRRPQILEIINDNEFYIIDEIQRIKIK
jgi:hypothetical protein